MISEGGNEKYFEGHGRGLLDVMSRHLHGGTKEIKVSSLNIPGVPVKFRNTPAAQKKFTAMSPFSDGILCCRFNNSLSTTWQVLLVSNGLTIFVDLGTCCSIFCQNLHSI